VVLSQLTERSLGGHPATCVPTVEPAYQLADRVQASAGEDAVNSRLQIRRQLHGLGGRHRDHAPPPLIDCELSTLLSGCARNYPGVDVVIEFVDRDVTVRVPVRLASTKTFDHEVREHRRLRLAAYLVAFPCVLDRIGRGQDDAP